MRRFQTVGMILAIASLCLLSARHVYHVYIRDRTSVMERYSETHDVAVKTNATIRKAASLDDLNRQYAEAREVTRELDAQLAKTMAEMPKEERQEAKRVFREKHEGEYRKTMMLEKAVRDWEEKSREITEIRFYWGVGLGLFLLGSLLCRFHLGIGMAFVVPGVVEMIWWSCPSINVLGGPVAEQYRLLMNRLVMGGIGLLIILAGYILAPRWQKEPRRELPES